MEASATVISIGMRFSGSENRLIELRTTRLEEVLLTELAFKMSAFSFCKSTSMLVNREPFWRLMLPKLVVFRELFIRSIVPLFETSDELLEISPLLRICRIEPLSKIMLLFDKEL